MPEPRRVQVSIARQPFGWRAPLYQALMLGYRQSRRGKRVPNIRVKTYPVEGMEQFQKAAIPLLRRAAEDAARAYGFELDDDAPLLRGPVALRLRAIHPRPRSEHRIRSDVPRARSERKPDLTNVVKLVEDCATRALWWRDDAQVAEQRNDAWTQEVAAHRCVRDVDCPVIDPPGVQIVAWELEPREE